MFSVLSDRHWWKIKASNQKRSVLLNLLLTRREHYHKLLPKMQVRLHFLILRIFCALRLTFLGLTLISV
ncbi:unnamed protein product [Hymenolepis diminuta]|uniref:Uncharacterized protein n=1 Tax=Hymenolepis diminuta TaxID=6216 RepID=A0A564ZFJ8_HYMDI|nr:unnamed protein product [Hymenolepis diminuta]